MHPRLAVPLIAASFFITTGVIAQSKPVTPDDRPALALVVVENTGRNQGGANTDFHRLDLAFEHVDEQRKWPVTIAAERFAANTAKHDTELRVFLKSVTEEVPGELTIRNWVTLTVKGQKHDFGIVTFRHYRRLGENMEDTLEKVFHGAAMTIAEKVEPILFPKAVDAKP